MIKAFLVANLKAETENPWFKIPYYSGMPCQTH